MQTGGRRKGSIRKMKMGLIFKKSLVCMRFRVWAELAVKIWLIDKLEKEIWKHCCSYCAWKAVNRE